ncbi:MAG: glycosyltransferase family 39 protein [Anaerolineae bacterium]|nr:glycosyltransferase family 39 protein [Anaerolineae bacterium]
MPKTTIECIFYSGILLLYFILAALFAIRTPDWQAPDEPAHYNNIAQIVGGDLLPEIEMGDWDNDYLETLKANDFAPELLDRLDTIQYEDHQPPLYYWIAAPIFALSDGSLTALRLYSVLLGGITVALTFTVTQTITPQRPHIALSAMAFVAFLPQQVHMTSTVNNDALAGVMIGATLLLLIRFLRQQAPFHSSDRVWLLGVLVGIIFITKTTIYFMAGVVLIVIFMRWWTDKPRRILTLARQFIVFAMPAGIFALIYWGRNVRVYGVPDFLGLIRHDEVVVGQLRTADYIEQIGTSAYWQTAIKTTVHSFWGQFGWMEARMADAVPSVMIFIGLLTLAAISGLVMLANQPKNDNAIPREIWITLGLALLLTVLQYIFYNLTFVQFQGRYLFTALIPIAIAMALGVDVWRNLIFSKITALSWATVGVFLLFVPLDFYLIWRVIPGAVGGIG